MKGKFLICALSAVLPCMLLLSACGDQANNGSDDPVDVGVIEPKVKTEVNLLDYEASKIGDDWSYAIKKAFGEGDVVYVPAGEYKASSISVPSDKELRGDGAATVFYPMTDVLFKIEGVTGGEVPLGKDMEDFSNTLELSKEQRLSEGDLIYLLSQRNSMILEDCGYDWCLGRAYKSGRPLFFAEFLTVSEVNGTEVKTLTNTIFPAYYADGSRESDPPRPSDANLAGWPYRRNAATVRKVIAAENIVLRDFTIVISEGTAISVTWAKNLLVSGVAGYSPEGVKAVRGLRFFSMSNSLDSKVENCSFSIKGTLDFDDKSAAYADYGVYNQYIIAGCQNSGFVGCSADNATHGFSISTVTKGGVSNNCYLIDSTMSRCKWAGVWSHHGTYVTTITGCTITDSTQGIKLGGRKNYISDNYIELNMPLDTNYYYVRPTDGGTVGIMLIEGYAVDSVVENNTVKNAYTGLMVRDGYEDLNRYEYGNILFKGNTVEGCRVGFHIWKNSSNITPYDLAITLEENIFKAGEFADAYCGVRIAPRTLGVMLWENEITGFQYGLVVEDMASDIALEDNTLSDGHTAILIKDVTPAELGKSYNKGLLTEISLAGNMIGGFTQEIRGETQPHVHITQK